VPLLLGVLLVFAPLFRGGRPPIPLLILQCAAVVLLALTAARQGAARLTKRELVAIGLLLLLPLLYLVPLPGVPLDWLPGRGLYAGALGLAAGEQIDRLTTLSIFPMMTEAAWLTLLIPVAVFVGTRTLDHPHQHRLVLVLVGVASVQAMIGLMQFGSGRDSLLYFGFEYANFGSGVGTYTNRNHLAGLLEMVLPVTLALYIYSLGRKEERSSKGWRGRLLFLSTLRGHTAFVYGALALLLIAGVIFTRSRAGIALTMLGLLLATFVFARRIGGDNVYGAAGTLVAFAVGIGIVIGLAPVLDRFAAVEPLEDSRWTIFGATLDGIGALFPVGSGPGTYGDVFYAFQPLELGEWWIDYAHNDYLQWLFEGGVAAALLGLFLLTLYAWQWRRVWTSETWSRFRFVQVGAGIGILLMLLHTFVDFNLHIPANMVYFAFLAGIFFSPPDDAAPVHRKRRHKRRTARLGEEEKLPAPGSFTPAKPAADQIPNPFAD
jgi:O-antigen ligase